MTVKQYKASSGRHNENSVLGRQGKAKVKAQRSADKVALKSLVGASR